MDALRADVIIFLLVIIARKLDCEIEGMTARVKERQLVIQTSLSETRSEVVMPDMMRSEVVKPEMMGNIYQRCYACTGDCEIHCCEML